MGFRLSRMNSGSSSGPELWRYNATAPGTNIELNTAEGVTGIDAKLPTLPSLRLFLNNVLGFNAGGFYYSFGSLIRSVGITGVGFVPASIFARDNSSNESAQLIAETNGVGKGIIRHLVSKLSQKNEEINFIDQHNRLVTDGATANTRKEQLTNSISDFVTNNITNDSTSKAQAFDALEENIYVASVAKIRKRFDLQGFHITDPAGSGDMFRVGADGKLYTDQIEALTATGAIINRVPIYNAANGLLVGYMPVYDAL